MRYLKIIFWVALIAGAFQSCRKYLDINSDPVNPQDPSITTLLPPIFGHMVRVAGLDGAAIGQYTQFYASPAASNQLDLHGGNTFGAGPRPEIWRRFYFDMAVSLNLMIEKGIRDEYWDFVGTSFALKAWGLQFATDMCGEVPFTSAWVPNSTVFPYDEQANIYKGIDSMCRQALFYLERNDGKVSQQLLRRADLVYSGDRGKWIKFTYGLLARLYNRQTNKSEYLSNGYADSVIKFTTLSFTSATDNFLAPHTATRNDDSNIFGPARGNYNTRLQSRYITQLLDGKTLTGSSAPANRDPRLSRMLSASFDTISLTGNYPELNGGYRSLVPGSGEPESAVSGFGTTGSAVFRRRVSLLYSDSTVVNLTGGIFVRAGKYVFQNNAPAAIMAYHELQFIKAEALFRKGDKPGALTAYRTGISAHMDFVNRLNTTANSVTQITTTQRDAYLNSIAVTQRADTLTISDIMIQKYIGDFGWNSLEAWSDLRRYHYFDLDGDSNTPVYLNFSIPTYFVNNLGPKPAYRFWPTDFSEFDWNSGAIVGNGGNNIDYHTYEMWFSQP